MSSLLKHQACCINAPWQPRLASTDVCLAWHFSRIPNQALPCLLTGLLHHRVELFIFICLCPPATLHLSALCPRLTVWTSTATSTLSRPRQSLPYCLEHFTSVFIYGYSDWLTLCHESSIKKKKTTTTPRVLHVHRYSYTLHLLTSNKHQILNTASWCIFVNSFFSAAGDTYCTVSEVTLTVNLRPYLCQS